MLKKTYFFSLILFQFSCNQEVTEPTNMKEIAKQGLVVGNPIIKEIDEKGGVIDIEMNNAKVLFPKNVVTMNTLVSVQPITNTFANYGLGLRISSHFKNIKIELKYPLNGLPEDTFEIYYLNTDSPNLGWVNLKNKSIDTVNHTISIIQNPENQLAKSSASGKIASHSFDYVVGK